MGIWLKFKNKNKKSICLFLFSNIMNLLNVRYISGIKRSKCIKYILALDWLNLTLKVMIHSTKMDLL